MKPFLPVCLAVLGLGFFAAAGAQDLKPITHPFYPLKVGNQWTYRAGKETVVIAVVKEVPFDNAPDIKTGKEKRAIGYALKIGNGERDVAEQVAVLEGGIYRFSAAGKSIKPPLLFFKLPLNLVKGEAWQVDCKTEDGKTIRGSFVGGTETLRLTLNGKAVELPTVTITSKDFHVDDHEMSITYWFARDIGLVKQRVRTGKDEVTMELESFKEGK
jgi:hypothetical protein